MKIKIDKLKIIDGKNLIVNIENIEFEISAKEIHEMNEHENKKSNHAIPQMSDYKLYYAKSLTEVRVNDYADILPSENCVTNTDKMRYDENISGLRVCVKSISISNNRVDVFSKKMGSFSVHPSWLVLYTRPIKSNEKVS